MTIVKAIKILTEPVAYEQDKDSQYSKAVHKAVEELGYRTGKTPIEKRYCCSVDDEPIIKWACPVCKRLIDATMYYCWNCGQKMDWSGYNE